MKRFITRCIIYMLIGIVLFFGGIMFYDWQYWALFALVIVADLID